MKVEIVSMLMVAYIFIFGKWTSPLFNDTKPILCFIEYIIPKITGALVLIYVVGKYILKLK